MKTRKQQMQSGGLDGYDNFLGDDSDYQNWYGILGQSRDSDILEKTNFTVGLNMLGGESDTVRVERYGHWAVGWIEEIYVKPESEAYKIAEGIEAKLADYPVLDEEAYSQAEFDDYCESWDNDYCQDFRRSLVEAFELSEAAESALDDVDNDELRALYESLVNNPYESDSGGVYCDIKTAVADCTFDKLGEVLGGYYKGLVEVVYSQALLTGSPDMFDDVLRCRWDDKADMDIETLEAFAA